MEAGLKFKDFSLTVDCRELLALGLNQYEGFK